MVANTLRANERNTSQGNGNYVTHALTSEGCDASEDGTGRGTPLVAAPLSHGSHPNSNAAGRRREDDENIVAFHMLQDPISEEAGITPAMGRGNKEGTASLGVMAPTLTSANDPSRSPQSSEITAQVEAVEQASMAVRRLTPTECCRLQGFPDDWFGEPNTPPDGPRYAALGDAVTVNVAEWIGRRIGSTDVQGDAND